ncbi:glycosyltransferase, partial [Alphaproteobacteria bacterium]|nr:glycosyltransferase [Alphaproteobacteria bacterium]
IATNFSGNTDFLSKETGFPVDYRLIATKANQYPGGDGQKWADPDIDHAAELMRQVSDDSEKSRKIAAAGRREIESTYSAKVVGQRYRKRLETLGLLSDVERSRV